MAEGIDVDVPGWRRLHLTALVLDVNGVRPGGEAEQQAEFVRSLGPAEGVDAGSEARPVLGMVRGSRRLPHREERVALGAA